MLEILTQTFYELTSSLSWSPLSGDGVYGIDPTRSFNAAYRTSLFNVLLLAQCALFPNSKPVHQNYIGVDGAREPYLLSVVQEGAGLLRAILFNKMGAHKIYLPASAWSGGGGQAPTRPTIKQILAQFTAIERLDKMPREITCPELQKDVLLLEEQEGSVNFKIGVMIMKPGQKTDDEMLSNEKGNEKWDRFISLLGDKIRLRSWNRFRGGLDVKGDMTGSHSIYTMHQGHEIMFHVSTMLPFSKDNKQQLERKRHIGNDIVNIVFTEDSTHNTFNPQCVKSHFTHIFAVVSEVEGEGYRLSVYTDDTVPPFGPSLPCPPIFNDPQLFREFLLVKLMNGEKAAFQTPTFALKRQRTLDTLIRDIYAEHCSDHKVPMLSRRALSDVWSGSAGAGGAGAARTERFLHVGQALKLDAVLRGDAPTSLVSMACAPEYVPLSREIDPCLALHDNYELVRQMSKCGPYSIDDDDNGEIKPNSIRQRLAELRVDSKSRGGDEEDSMDIPSVQPSMP
ncbi:jg12715 [Pararge aegeria aegeria]|uniref:Jg12715 protein n=1 Tax=Pararge aegeria aegeria TaxID=348720 RepID=A0A8S4RY71_9NEOP|nr:jg12715 [Pararge aegeria aegeria]